MESQNGDIFDAISHEIRRKIIQLLAEKPKTFSELQKDLGLDSPALAFHIRKLNGLISKNDQGYYELTPLGVKALNVIRQIHNEVPTQTNSNQANSNKEDEEEKGAFLLIPGLSSLFKSIQSIAEIPSKLDETFVRGFGWHRLLEVYNGPLSVKPNLTVSIDGGMANIYQGDPHAVIKCVDEDGFHMKDIGNELRIEINGCYAVIYYPSLNSLKGEVDGGAIVIKNSIVNISIEIDGGTFHADVDNVVNSKIQIDGGVANSKLRYAGEGTLYTEIDGGTANLDLEIPSNIGIIFNKNVNGGFVKGDKNVVKEKNVIANIEVDWGIVSVNTRVY